MYSKNCREPRRMIYFNVDTFHASLIYELERLLVVMAENFCGLAK